MDVPRVKDAVDVLERLEDLRVEGRPGLGDVRVGHQPDVQRVGGREASAGSMRGAYRELRSGARQDPRDHQMCRSGGSK